MKRIKTPITDEVLVQLSVGDSVLLSGIIYTGRDAAHKRMTDGLATGKPLPFNSQGSVIYYVGPCPAPPGMVIGSCGPTTTYRMDPFAPTMLEEGLAGAIGKGSPGEDVISAIVKRGGVHFSATGGAAALIASCVIRCDVIAYPDLGTEAVHRLEVVDMPLIVSVDSRGNSLYTRD